MYHWRILYTKTATTFRGLTFRKIHNVSLCICSLMLWKVAKSLFFQANHYSIWESKCILQCIPAMTDGRDGICRQQIFVMFSCSVHSTAECTTEQLEARNGCQKFHWLVIAFVSQRYFSSRLFSSETGLSFFFFSRQIRTAPSDGLYFLFQRGLYLRETSLLKMEL